MSDLQESVPVHAAGSLLAQRPFVLFWCARISTTVASQMQAVAIGWQMYQLTGSAFQLGLVGLVQFIPVVMLSLMVGHFADRYDRKTIIRTCEIVEALAAATLAAGSFMGWMTPGILLALVFVFGCARAFELPTMHAIVPGLVPSRLFSRAVAGSASANQTAVILGPCPTCTAADHITTRSQHTTANNLLDLPRY